MLSITCQKKPGKTISPISYLKRPCKTKRQRKEVLKICEEWQWKDGSYRLCLSGYPVKLVWAIKHVFLNNVETANPKKFTLTKFSEQNEEEQKEKDRKRRKLGNFICKQCNTWLNEKNIVDDISCIGRFRFLLKPEVVRFIRCSFPD